MEETRTYENFPLWIVLLSNLISISVYIIGAYILAGFGLLFSVLYLLYCFWIEMGILRGSCANCYYYGKVCGFGRGKLCSLLFKKGDSQKFVEMELSWPKMLLDFMIVIFPIVGGIILLVKDFNWPLVAILVALAILYLAGNAIIRGSFTCKYCKQREIGCPAEKMFSKE